MLSSYYEILGLNANASDDDIRRAYRQKAKQYHPDVNKSPDAHSKFLLIKKAYDVLTNRNNYTYNSTYSYAPNTNPMSSFEAYMAWKKAQEMKYREEARKRHEQFLKNRDKFRQSFWYYPLILLTYIALGFCYLFGAAVIVLCAYIIHKTHVAFVLLMLPFISGGVYFIRSTGNWYKEAKKYF